MLDRRARASLAVAGFLAVLLDSSGAAAEGADAPDAEAAAPIPGDTGAATASSPPSFGTEAPAPAPGAAPGYALFEQSVSASAATVSASGVGPEAAPLNLAGYVRGDMYVGKVPGSSQGDIKAGYGEAAVRVRTKKERFGDGFAELRLRYGMQGEPQEQATGDVREAYVNTYLGPLDLRLGKQIVVWGRADLLNPTNNVTPLDLSARSPIEDDRRVGNVGARAFLRLAPFRVEGVWMPLYVATTLPPVSLPPLVSYADPIYPKNQLDDGLVAGRVHLELPAVEMSVSYLHGYAPLPGLTRSSVTQGDNPQVLIARTAYHQQVVGFDFSTALGDILALRGEAAYRRPYDYQNLADANVPFPDLQYALGADHTFASAFSSVSVIVQYLGRYAFDWQKQAGSPAGNDTSLLSGNQVTPQLAEQDVDLQLAKTNQILFSQTAQLQHLATIRVEWLTAHDTLSISMLGLVNFTTKEWLASPKIGYHLSDATIVYVGAEILNGPTNTLFGLVGQQMSAGYAELRSTF